MMVNGLVFVATILAQNPIADELKRFDRLIAEGEFQQVSTELRRFTEENPKSPRALYQLGYAYYRLHQIPAAVRALSASSVGSGFFAMPCLSSQTRSPHWHL